MDCAVITTLFTSFDDLPNLDHLRKVENSYIEAFNGDIVYVSYIINNGNVVAFGSCGYYHHDNYYGKDRSRQLWIEGVVSIIPGCGTIVLQALESSLKILADKYQVSKKIIHVMSIEESVGFYEKNGYIECNTSARFAGTGNMHCAKGIDGFSLDSVKLSKYRHDQDLYQHVVRFILVGRRLRVDEYMNIPPEIHNSELIKYVSEHIEDPNLFREYVKYIQSDFADYFREYI